MTFSIHFSPNKVRLGRSVNQRLNQLNITFKRLSKGLRLINATDDVAGLRIKTLLESQLIQAQKEIEGTTQQMSLLQTLDGALSNSEGNLLKMRELALMAANGSTSFLDRQTLNQELNKIMDELRTISNTAVFNGIKLLNADEPLMIALAHDDPVQPLLTINSVAPEKLGRQSSVSSLRRGLFLDPLDAGDVIINGVSIRATTDADDQVSYSHKAGSALSKAKAINDATPFTGVTAWFEENVIRGIEPLRELDFTGSHWLNINGWKVSGFKLEEKDASGMLLKHINAGFAESGVEATTDHEGNLTLRAVDGRNITIEYSDADVRNAIRLIDFYGDPINLGETVDSPIYYHNGDIIDVDFETTGSYNDAFVVHGNYEVAGVNYNDHTGGHVGKTDYADYHLEIIKPGGIGEATYRIKKEDLAVNTIDSEPESGKFNATGVVTSSLPARITAHSSTYYNSASDRRYRIKVLETGDPNTQTNGSRPLLEIFETNMSDNINQEVSLGTYQVDNSSTIDVGNGLVLQVNAQTGHYVETPNGEQVITDTDYNLSGATAELVNSPLGHDYPNHPIVTAWNGANSTQFEITVYSSGHSIGQYDYSYTDEEPATIVVTAENIVTGEIKISDPLILNPADKSFTYEGLTFHIPSEFSSATVQADIANYISRTNGLPILPKTYNRFVNENARKYVLTPIATSVITDSSPLTLNVEVYDINPIGVETLIQSSEEEFELGTWVGLGRETQSDGSVNVIEADGGIALFEWSSVFLASQEEMIPADGTIEFEQNTYGKPEDHIGVLEITTAGEANGLARYKYFYEDTGEVIASDAPLLIGGIELPDGIKYQASNYSGGQVTLIEDHGAAFSGGLVSSSYTGEQRGHFTLDVSHNNAQTADLTQNISTAYIADQYEVNTASGDIDFEQHNYTTLESHLGVMEITSAGDADGIARYKYFYEDTGEIITSNGSLLTSGVELPDGIKYLATNASGGQAVLTEDQGLSFSGGLVSSSYTGEQRGHFTLDVNDENGPTVNMNQDVTSVYIADQYEENPASGNVEFEKNNYATLEHHIGVLEITSAGDADGIARYKYFYEDTGAVITSDGSLLTSGVELPDGIKYIASNASGGQTVLSEDHGLAFSGGVVSSSYTGEQRGNFTLDVSDDNGQTADISQDVNSVYIADQYEVNPASGNIEFEKNNYATLEHHIGVLEITNAGDADGIARYKYFYEDTGAVITSDGALLTSGVELPDGIKYVASNASGGQTVLTEDQGLSFSGGLVSSSYTGEQRGHFTLDVSDDSGQTASLSQDSSVYIADQYEVAPADGDIVFEQYNYGTLDQHVGVLEIITAGDADGLARYKYFYEDTGAVIVSDASLLTSAIELPDGIKYQASNYSGGHATLSEDQGLAFSGGLISANYTGEQRGQFTLDVNHDNNQTADLDQDGGPTAHHALVNDQYNGYHDGTYTLEIRSNTSTSDPNDYLIDVNFNFNDGSSSSSTIAFVEDTDIDIGQGLTVRFDSPTLGDGMTAVDERMSFEGSVIARQFSGLLQWTYADGSSSGPQNVSLDVDQITDLGHNLNFKVTNLDQNMQFIGIVDPLTFDVGDQWKFDMRDGPHAHHTLVSDQYNSYHDGTYTLDIRSNTDTLDPDDYLVDVNFSFDDGSSSSNTIAFVADTNLDIGHGLTVRFDSPSLGDGMTAVDERMSFEGSVTARQFSGLLEWNYADGSNSGPKTVSLGVDQITDLDNNVSFQVTNLDKSMAFTGTVDPINFDVGDQWKFDMRDGPHAHHTLVSDQYNSYHDGTYTLNIRSNTDTSDPDDYLIDVNFSFDDGSSSSNTIAFVADTNLDIGHGLTVRFDSPTLGDGMTAVDERMSFEGSVTARQFSGLLEWNYADGSNSGPKTVSLGVDQITDLDNNVSFQVTNLDKSMAFTGTVDPINFDIGDQWKFDMRDGPPTHHTLVSDQYTPYYDGTYTLNIRSNTSTPNSNDYLIDINFSFDDGSSSSNTITFVEDTDLDIGYGLTVRFDSPSPGDGMIAVDDTMSFGGSAIASQFTGQLQWHYADGSNSGPETVLLDINEVTDLDNNVSFQVTNLDKDMTFTGTVDPINFDVGDQWKFDLHDGPPVHYTLVNDQYNGYHDGTYTLDIRSNTDTADPNDYLIDVNFSFDDGSSSSNTITFVEDTDLDIGYGLTVRFDSPILGDGMSPIHEPITFLTFQGNVTANQYFGQLQWNYEDGSASGPTTVSLGIDQVTDLDHNLSLQITDLDQNMQFTGTVDPRNFDIGDQWKFDIRARAFLPTDSYTIQHDAKDLLEEASWEITGKNPNEWLVDDEIIIDATNNYGDPIKVLSNMVEYVPESGDGGMGTVELNGSGDFKTGDLIKMKTRAFMGEVESYSGNYTFGHYPTTYIFTVTKGGSIDEAEISWVREDLRTDTENQGSGILGRNEPLTVDEYIYVEEGVRVRINDVLDGLGDSIAYFAQGDEFSIKVGENTKYTFAGQLILKSDENIELAYRSFEEDNSLGRLNFLGTVTEANEEGGEEYSLESGVLGKSLNYSLANTNLLSSSSVREALHTIDLSLKQVGENRSIVGGSMNKVEHQAKVLSQKTMDLVGIQMRLTNADVAQETAIQAAELIKLNFTPLLVKTTRKTALMILDLVNKK